MRHVRQSNWRTYRIPIRVIEQVYGRGNFDDAGDDIWEVLRDLSEYADQYLCRVDFDANHVNPWYHVMVFAIEDIPDLLHSQFVERLTKLGLPPDSG